MKNALLFIKSSANLFETESVKQVLFALNSGGIVIDTIEILSGTDDIGFVRRFEDLRNTKDNLIIVASEDIGFNLKEYVAEKMESELVENERALELIKQYCSDEGQASKMSIFPQDATVIPNLKGAEQGFMMEDNEFSLCVLPSSIEQVVDMCNGYVVPYFETKYNLSPKKITLKYFGNSEVVHTLLDSLKKEYTGSVHLSINTVYKDTTINLVFERSEDSRLIDEFVRKVVEGLKDGLYAQTNVTLSECLFELLKIRKLKLSVAESFTGGRIVSEMIKNSGVSEYLDEGIVSYSNHSKVNRLGVSEQDLRQVGAVSSKVAYQMAAGLLSAKNCDVAIATTGIAGPKSDDTNKPVGLCYIAVGSSQGVHVYKYVLNGSREEITETAKNTALFLAIKNIKNK